MQKKIIALAIAAAFAAPVAAMADVTVYGTMDGGIRHQTNDSAAAGGTTDSMAMGQYNTARWGFKSVEDMGDGLKTNVTLETSYQPKSVGAPGVVPTNPYGLIFDRQATIGLSGDWGSADMGWNYTTSFKVIKTYDPFDYHYLSVAGAKTSDLQDRAGNLTYTGKFGDVTVMAEYDMNNSSPTTQPTTGTGRAIGVTYASGAVNVGAAYSTVEPSLGKENAVTHITAGAGLNFGDGKVSVGYAKQNTAITSGVSDATATNMWLGASFNMSSKASVTAAYYKKTTNAGGANIDADSNTVMAGLAYNLSKKTQAYVELDKSTAVGTGGAKDVVTSGSMIGLSTAF